MKKISGIWTRDLFDKLDFLFPQDLNLVADGGQESAQSVPQPLSIKTEKLCGFEVATPESAEDDEPAASPDPGDVITNASNDASAAIDANIQSDAGNGGNDRG